MAQRAVDPFYVSLTSHLFMTRSGLQSCFYGGDGEEDEDEDTDEDEDEDTDDGGGSGSEDPDKDKEKDGDDDEETEADRLKKRLRAADKNNSTLQKRLKDLEDKDKDEVTKATERADAAEKQVNDLSAEVSGLRLQNAFLVSNTYAWEDPEYALDFAQRKGYLDGVLDEDDGSVDSKALAKGLDRLAKDRPAMIKKAEEDPGKDQPGTKGGSPGAGKKGKQKADTEDLRRRFPNAYR